MSLEAENATPVIKLHVQSSCEAFLNNLEQYPCQKLNKYLVTCGERWKSEQHCDKDWIINGSDVTGNDIMSH